MIKFKATDQQILQIAANAFNASTPMGLGFFSYDPQTNAVPDDFKENLRINNESGYGYISLDYVQGRMVKLYASRKENVWQMRAPIPEYQSWIHNYPTARHLIESVGAEVLEDEDAEG
jgi:hypothetical protein